MSDVKPLFVLRLTDVTMLTRELERRLRRERHLSLS